MINWKVRIKQKWFWVSIVCWVLLLIQAILAPFDIKIDFGFLNEYFTTIINALFGLLGLIGIVQDPTTEGVGDSSLAMTYEFPKNKLGEYKYQDQEGK